MRSLKDDGTASVVIRGHAFMQNLRRSHYQLGHQTTEAFQLEAAFSELLATVRTDTSLRFHAITVEPPRSQHTR